MFCFFGILSLHWSASWVSCLCLWSSSIPARQLHVGYVRAHPWSQLDPKDRGVPGSYSVTTTMVSSTLLRYHVQKGLGGAEISSCGKIFTSWASSNTRYRVVFGSLCCWWCFFASLLSVLSLLLLLLAFILRKKRLSSNSLSPAMQNNKWWVAHRSVIVTILCIFVTE